MNDPIAELAGYRAELDFAASRGKDGRAGSIRKEIDRVTGRIKAEADEADAKAKEYDEAGQDVPAAEARVEAKRLRRALADNGAPETAADTKPRETAVTKPKTR